MFLAVTCAAALLLLAGCDTATTATGDAGGAPASAGDAGGTLRPAGDAGGTLRPAGDAGGTLRPAGDAGRGKLLMPRYHCGACHAVPGVAAADGRLAPSLEAFGRRSYIAGKVPNVDDRLVAWIVDPASLVPDTAMPAMGVSAADARDIAAYLRSLR